MRHSAANVRRVSNYQAVVLVSFGGPESAEDVMPYLRRVTAGRGIPEQRVQAVAEHYYDAGGASPLNARCRELMDALGPRMAQLSLRLYWGNRNWHPLLEDTVVAMRDEGVDRALAFVTSAYGGYSSCRHYLDDIASARAKAGPRAPVIDKLRLYYNHPRWVDAWARATATALHQCKQKGIGDIELLFSAHSIPVSMAASSPYVAHVTESARLVAEATGCPRWRLVWQSRSGSPATPWLGPDITEVLDGCEASAVVVVPIGFACENMEVVHDLDVEAAEVAKKKGAMFVRATCASTDPAFAEMVTELVHERLAPASAKRSLGELGPWPDQCPTGHCPPPVKLASG